VGHSDSRVPTRTSSSYAPLSVRSSDPRRGYAPPPFDTERCPQALRSAPCATSGRLIGGRCRGTRPEGGRASALEVTSSRIARSRGRRRRPRPGDRGPRPGSRRGAGADPDRRSGPRARPARPRWFRAPAGRAALRLPRRDPRRRPRLRPRARTDRTRPDPRRPRRRPWWRPRRRGRDRGPQRDRHDVVRLELHDGVAAGRAAPTDVVALAPALRPGVDDHRHQARRGWCGQPVQRQRGLRRHRRRRGLVPRELPAGVWGAAAGPRHALRRSRAPRPGREPHRARRRGIRPGPRGLVGPGQPGRHRCHRADLGEHRRGGRPDAGGARRTDALARPRGHAADDDRRRGRGGRRHHGGQPRRFGRPPRRPRGRSPAVGRPVSRPGPAGGRPASSTPVSVPRPLPDRRPRRCPRARWLPAPPARSPSSGGVASRPRVSPR